MLMGLLGVVMGFLASIPPMGPIGLLVVQRGFLRRYREAFAIGVGGSISESVYCSFAAFGVTVLLEKYNVLGTHTRVVGGLILIALAIYFIRSRPGKTKESATAEQGGWGKSVLLGATISALNPALILVWSGNFSILYSIVGLEPQPSHRVFFPIGVGAGMILWYFTLTSLQRRHAENFTVATIYRLMRMIGWIILVVGVAVVLSPVLSWSS